MKKSRVLLYCGPVALVMLANFIALFITSLTDFNKFTQPNFIGFSNYMRLSNDRLVGIALQNTLLLYALTSLIVGGVALLVHEILRKHSKSMYYCCVFIFSLASAIIVYLAFISVNSVNLIYMPSFIFDGPVFIYFIAATLGITLMLLQISAESCRKVTRRVMAFVLPLTLTLLFEHRILNMIWPWHITEIDATVTLTSLANDYSNLRFEAGYSSAILVVNALIVAVLTALAAGIVLIVQKLLHKRAGVGL